MSTKRGFYLEAQLDQNAKNAFYGRRAISAKPVRSKKLHSQHARSPYARTANHSQACRRHSYGDSSDRSKPSRFRAASRPLSCNKPENLARKASHCSGQRSRTSRCTDVQAEDLKQPHRLRPLILVTARKLHGIYIQDVEHQNLA